MIDIAPLYCQRLVTEIEETLGRPLTAPVRQAFLQVSRHLFIPHYYESGHLHTAPPYSDQSAWAAWLSKLYHDQALTTQVDARGLPTSSSSQPGVMAVMLEHLALAPGLSVLEIGTGTGYNACLMAVLVGTPSLVTSVEIDPTLIEQARSRIASVVGEGMTLQTCNGIEGYAPRAPYECIIATASTLPLPWAWIEQLKPGGKLVMDVRGHLGGGLLTLTKHADSTAVGNFLTDWLEISFMGLRSSAQDLAIPDFPHAKGKAYQRLPIQETAHLAQGSQAYLCASHFATYEQFRGPDDDFNLWLQWMLPGLSIKWKGSPDHLHAILSDETTHTVATIEPQAQDIQITVYGQRPLWSEIRFAYQEWLEAAKPGRESYTLHVDLDQRSQVMRMQHQDTSRTFPLA